MKAPNYQSYSKGGNIMKILVTGVTGRIGANLASALIKKGYQVRGLVMPGDPKADKARRLGVEVFEADIGDATGVHRAVDGVDVVAHLAAQMQQGELPAERMFIINTLGTVNLLEGAIKASRRPKRFLFASTDQTYSPFVPERTTFYEEHAQKPSDIYGLGKYLSEEICFEYMREYGLPVTIVRYSSVLAGDEALIVLSPWWLKYYIDLWTAPGHPGRFPLRTCAIPWRALSWPWKARTQSAMHSIWWGPFPRPLCPRPS
jgi:UDP-glucose 4-epimerase